MSGGTSKRYLKLSQCAAGSGCEKKDPPKTKCGDGKCEGKEDETTCPQDCKKAPVCGDGKCEDTENALSCPADCKTVAKCGDLVCVAPTETLISCPLDCNVDLKAQALCLKGKCATNLETCASDPGCLSGLLCAFACSIGDQQCLSGCQSKAGAGSGIFKSLVSCAVLNDCALGSKAKCGNGKCEAGEDPTTCPKDCGSCANACNNKECGKVVGCPNVCGGCGAGKKCENNLCTVGQPFCGDGSCDGTENATNCSKDCKTGTTQVCGNGKCETGETNAKCPQDCPKTTCGNGKCETGETPTSCAQDCPKTSCGDGKCEGNEKATCPSDCGGGSGTCKNSACKFVAGAKCQCDTACSDPKYNDCCPDKKSYCK